MSKKEIVNYDLKIIGKIDKSLFTQKLPALTKDIARIKSIIDEWGWTDELSIILPDNKIDFSNID